MLNLNEEKKYFKEGHNFVVGVDEVGRGPLAGPVLSACVAIEKNQKIDKRLLEEVNDSKKISEKKREILCDLIFDNFKHIGVAVCDRIIIDRINILEASLLAMKKAIEKLDLQPSIVLVDGNKKIKKLASEQKTITKGDSKIFCIAAASIVAKVARDNIMKKYHERYPNYSFDKHKGYGTKLHMERLVFYGACPIHRRSFAPVARVLL